MIERNIVDIYKGPDFWARGENCNGTIFIHCDIYQNKKNTFKKAKAMFEDLKQQALANGYLKPILSYTQNPRFCKLMGGTYLTTFEHEGETFEVWEWELQKHH